MRYVGVVQIADHFQINLLTDVDVLAYKYCDVHKSVYRQREAQHSSIIKVVCRPHPVLGHDVLLQNLKQLHNLLLSNRSAVRT